MRQNLRIYENYSTILVKLVSKKINISKLIKKNLVKKYFKKQT